MADPAQVGIVEQKNIDDILEEVNLQITIREKSKSKEEIHLDAGKILEGN